MEKGGKKRGRGRPAVYPGVDLAHLNLRIPAAELDRVTAAAQAAGMERRRWLERKLWAALGIDTNRAATAA